MEISNLAEFRIKLYYLRFSNVYSKNKQAVIPVKDQKVLGTKNSELKDIKQLKQ